jgi:hypothetical protein
MNALLEKALSKTVTYNYGAKLPSDDEIGLVIAFLKGEIDTAQYSYALDSKKPAAYSGIVSILRRAYKAGKVTLEQVE